MIGAWKDLVYMQSLPTSGTFRCAAARRAPGVFEGKGALLNSSRKVPDVGEGKVADVIIWQLLKCDCIHQRDPSRRRSSATLPPVHALESGWRCLIARRLQPRYAWKVAGGRVRSCSGAGNTLEPSTASHLPAVLQQGFAQINESMVIFMVTA